MITPRIVEALEATRQALSIYYGDLPEADKEACIRFFGGLDTQETEEAVSIVGLAGEVSPTFLKRRRDHRQESFFAEVSMEGTKVISVVLDMAGPNLRFVNTAEQLKKV